MPGRTHARTAIQWVALACLVIAMLLLTVVIARVISLAGSDTAK